MSTNLGAIHIVNTLSGEDALAGWVRVGVFITENGQPDWCKQSALECYETALSYKDTDTSEEWLADLYLNYGICLTEHGSGYRDPDLTIAITYLDNALQIFQKQNDDEAQHEAIFYMAYAKSEFVGPDRYEANEEVIRDLENLLVVLKDKNDPILKANIYSIISNAYLDRLEGAPRENLKNAMEATKAGIALFRKAKSQAGLMQGHLNLSVIYNRLIPLGDLEAVEKAIHYGRQALKYADCDVPCEVMTGIYTNIAVALAERGGRQWRSNCHKAFKLFSNAIDLAETHRSEAANVVRLQRADLILGYIENPDDDLIEIALQDLEICDGAFDRQQTPQWWKMWIELRGRLASFLSAPREMLELAEIALAQADQYLIEESNFTEKVEYLSQIRLIIDTGILGHLEADGPIEAVIFARQVYGKLFGFDPSPYENDDDSAELYLLNPISDQHADLLLLGKGQYDHYQIEGLGLEFWKGAQSHFLPGYFSGLSKLRDHQSTSLFKAELMHWIETISGNLGPVVSDLVTEGYHQLTIFAFGGWCTVPIAAILIPDHEAEHLVDKLSLLNGPHQHLIPSIKHERILHVLDKTLKASDTETKTLQTMANAYTACDSLAGLKDHLLSDQEYDIIHFTSHGDHNFEYLEGAGIKLPDGNLTARWIFENLKFNGHPLIVMAACHTGLTDFAKIPHEAFGLPNAFLKAGAKAVISTMWPIDDEATALLMSHFYEKLAQGVSISSALQKAQIWLRDQKHSDFEAQSQRLLRFTNLDIEDEADNTKPFVHPYYWTGFTLHQA